MMERSKTFAALVLCTSLVLMLVMGLMETTTNHTPAFWVGELGFLFFSFLSFGFMIANGDLPLHDSGNGAKALRDTRPIVQITFGDKTGIKDLADFMAQSIPESSIEDDSE